MQTKGRYKEGERVSATVAENTSENCVQTGIREAEKGELFLKGLLCLIL